MNRNQYPKGSKGMIQCLVKEHKHLLDQRLGAVLRWISPIEKDGFAEYQLNGDKLSNELGLSSNAFNNFWPTRQPQWDGVAMDDEHKILYLVEAKSRLSEIQSGNYLAEDASENQKLNFSLKEKALLSIKKHYASGAEDKRWLHTYYQITNRLAFLRKMKELGVFSEAYYDVKLIFLNFENDSSWEAEKKSVPNNGWKKKYDMILENLCISKEQLQNEGVLIIDIDGSDF